MKKRLLIIDDEVCVRNSLASILKDDFDLLLSDNAEEAWELIFFFGEHVDLIITDIVLPGMDGLEFLKKLREINNWVPAMVITGKSNHERAANAANLKISAYIQKPFDLESLHVKIDDVFQNNEGFPCSAVAPTWFLNKDPASLAQLTVRALSEIHKTFHSKFSVADLAERLGISDHQLSNTFKADCGITVRSYLLQLRIETAIKLLKKTRYPVTKIIEMVGLNNRSHFYNAFRQMTGVSPEEFRKDINLHTS